MIQKRFCDKPKHLGQRCCWMCDQHCKVGLKCQAIDERKGVCMEDYDG